MFYKGKNVLVAGGAGLLGQSLIPKLLEQGAHVRATQYKHRRIEIEHKNLEVVSCDLMDMDQARQAFKNMDIVFLSAGKVRGAKETKEDPSSLILHILDLHTKLFSLAAAFGAERCAFISSSFVYPDTGRPSVESEGFDGDTFVKTHYGIGWTFRYLETLCKHFALSTKTRYSIIRPTSYYGPFDNFNLGECHVIPALIVKAAQRMNPFEVWGKGEEVRSFTYVDDVAEGVMLAVEKYAEAQGINICTKNSNRVREAMELILELSDFKPEIRFDSTKPTTISYRVSDPSKAKQVLGWEAKVSLRDGLQKTIQWYMERQKVPAGSAA